MAATGPSDTFTRAAKVTLDPAILQPISSELFKTSLRLVSSNKDKGLIGVVQKKISPERGTIRYQPG
jgi:hypothetical protein